MLRSSPFVQRWLLALAMLCLLLAWPLHQAQHASEPLSAAAVLADSAVDGGEGSEHHAALCLWCLVHASHDAMSAAPLEFRFHAEASAPPALLAAGHPREHCALAADPRGPPTA